MPPPEQSASSGTPQPDLHDRFQQAFRGAGMAYRGERGRGRGRGQNRFQSNQAGPDSGSMAHGTFANRGRCNHLQTSNQSDLRSPNEEPTLAGHNPPHSTSSQVPTSAVPQTVEPASSGPRVTPDPTSGSVPLVPPINESGPQVSATNSSQHPAEPRAPHQSLISHPTSHFNQTIMPEPASHFSSPYGLPSIVRKGELVISPSRPSEMTTSNIPHPASSAQMTSPAQNPIGPPPLAAVPDRSAFSVRPIRNVPLTPVCGVMTDYNDPAVPVGKFTRQRFHKQALHRKDDHYHSVNDVAVQSRYLFHLVERQDLNRISKRELEANELFRIKLEAAVRDVAGRYKKEHALSFNTKDVYLKCYGSLASGFAVPGSDMDLLMILPKDKGIVGSLQDDCKRLMEEAFLKRGYGARLLTKTRVPILRVCEKPDVQLFEDLKTEREKWDTEVKDKEEAKSLQARGLNADRLPDDVGTNQSKTTTLAVGELDTEPSSIPLPPSPDRHHSNLEFHNVGIQCDINFSNYVAIHNTHLLRCYSICDARVQKMGLFVKAWAKARKINTPYHGTLSSYGYINMVLHYLMNIADPPVIPNLQHIAKVEDSRNQKTDIELFEGYDIRYIQDMSMLDYRRSIGKMTKNMQDVGTLLRGFFRYYSDPRGFHWKNEAISIRTQGGILLKTSKGWTEAKVGGPSNSVRLRYMLSIEDPFELEHNIGRTVGFAGASAIRDEFNRAWFIISKIRRFNGRYTWHRSDGLEGEDLLAEAADRGDLLQVDRDFGRERGRLRDLAQKREAEAQAASQEGTVSIQDTDGRSHQTCCSACSQGDAKNLSRSINQPKPKLTSAIGAVQAPNNEQGKRALVWKSVDVEPPAATPEPKTEIKDESNIEVKDEPKTEVRDATNFEVKDEPKVEVKDAPSFEVKDELKAEIQDAPHFDANDAPKFEVKDEKGKSGYQPKDIRHWVASTVTYQTIDSESEDDSDDTDMATLCEKTSVTRIEDGSKSEAVHFLKEPSRKLQAGQFNIDPKDPLSAWNITTSEGGWLAWRDRLIRCKRWLPNRMKTVSDQELSGQNPFDVNRPLPNAAQQRMLLEVRAKRLQYYENLDAGGVTEVAGSQSSTHAHDETRKDSAISMGKQRRKKNKNKKLGKSRAKQEPSGGMTGAQRPQKHIDEQISNEGDIPNQSSADKDATITASEVQSPETSKQGSGGANPVEADEEAKVDDADQEKCQDIVAQASTVPNEKLAETHSLEQLQPASQAEMKPDHPKASSILPPASEHTIVVSLNDPDLVLIPDHVDPGSSAANNPGITSEPTSHTLKKLLARPESPMELRPNMLPIPAEPNFQFDIAQMRDIDAVLDGKNPCQRSEWK